jgi:hypothetical protein
MLALAGKSMSKVIGAIGAEPLVARLACTDGFSVMVIVAVHRNSFFRLYDRINSADHLITISFVSNPFTFGAKKRRDHNSNTIESLDEEGATVMTDYLTARSDVTL